MRAWARKLLTRAFFRIIDLAQSGALRSIIRDASIDCAEIFARNLECAASTPAQMQPIGLDTAKSRAL
jgi:hypothetical protein